MSTMYAVAGVILYVLCQGVVMRLVGRRPAHKYVVNGDYGSYDSFCNPAKHDYCFKHGALAFLWPIAVPIWLAFWILRRTLWVAIRSTYRLGRGGVRP